MDTYEDGASEGVMIALLPTNSEWCHIELPHMTLVYAGKKKDLGPVDFSELAKDAAMLASISSPIGLRVLQREVFGEDDEKVDVFRLQPTPELWAMRRAVEDWNKSEFPFNPHVTIGPVGSFVEFPPRYLSFDRVAVGWGGEYLTFWLKR